MDAIINRSAGHGKIFFATFEKLKNFFSKKMKSTCGLHMERFMVETKSEVKPQKSSSNIIRYTWNLKN